MADWTWIPPALSGRQEEGTGLLPLGRYRMPDGSQQVSFGLPQGGLDLWRSLRQGLGYEQDPNAPPGYVSEGSMLSGAIGGAGGAMTGGLSAGIPNALMRGGMTDSLAANGVLGKRGWTVPELDLPIQRSSRQHVVDVPDMTLVRQAGKDGGDQLTSYFFAEKDGKSPQGVATIRQSPEGLYADVVAVDPSLRGKGLAQRAYDAIERDLNAKLQPGPVLSDAGLKMWRKRNPEAVEKYTERDPGWWASPGESERLKKIYE